MFLIHQTIQIRKMCIANTVSILNSTLTTQICYNSSHQNTLIEARCSTHHKVHHKVCPRTFNQSEHGCCELKMVDQSVIITEIKINKDSYQSKCPFDIKFSAPLLLKNTQRSSCKNQNQYKYDINIRQAWWFWWTDH